PPYVHWPPAHPHLHSFPTRRSSDLASHAGHFDVDWSAPKLIVPALADPYGVALGRGDFGLAFDRYEGTFSFTSNGLVLPLTPPSDRKSTRLNSSHDQISYAVFCLKK